MHHQVSMTLISLDKASMHKLLERKIMEIFINVILILPRGLVNNYGRVISFSAVIEEGPTVSSEYEKRNYRGRYSCFLCIQRV